MTDDKLNALMRMVTTHADIRAQHPDAPDHRAVKCDMCDTHLLATAAAARAYGRAVAIAELEAATGGGGCCLCGAVDPDWVCLAHKRIDELRAEDAG